MERMRPYGLVTDEGASSSMDACDILKEAGFRCYEVAIGEKAMEMCRRPDRTFRYSSQSPGGHSAR